MMSIDANPVNEGLSLIDAFINRLGGPIDAVQKARVLALAVQKAKPAILRVIADLEHQGAELGELRRIEAELADAVKFIVERRIALANRNRTRH